MNKTPYLKPDLQIIEIEAEEVIAYSEGGTGKPGSGGNTNPGVTSNSYTNTYNNSNRWEE